MSNVPKLRFSEFIGEWEEKKLENYGKLINGLTYSPDNIVEKGLLVLRSSNIQNQQISFHDNVYVDLDIKEEYLTKENDILICVRNGSKRLIGKSLLIQNNLPKATHGAFMTVFRGESNKFISHWFKTPIFFKEVYKNLGATINSINGSDLKKFKTIFPLKQEQEKIASFLTSVDTKIEQLTKKESLLQEYKKGVMQKIFNQEVKFKDSDGRDFKDWEEDKLGNYINLFSGFAFKGTDISDNSQGIPLLRGINITEGRIRHSKEIDRFFCGEIDKLEKYFVKENDLVISMDGSKVGKNVALIKNIDANALLVQRVARIRENRHSNIHFIYQIIYSNYFVRYIDIVNTSSGIPHISSQQIKDFKFNFPSREEQTKIANFLSLIDKKIENTKNELVKTKEFKKALLQQMFV
jgi:type I restriction enzyme S subunit